MNFAFTTEQEELRRTARRFLEQHSSPRRVRAAMATETGHDAEARQRAFGDIGTDETVGQRLERFSC